MVFERRRQEYYDHSQSVSQKGEWESWVQFFLSGVAEQSLDAVRRAAGLRALRDEYHASLEHHPAITVPGAARQLKVTQRAASQNIGKLVRVGILAEATGRSRNRIFAAHGIIRAIEEELPAGGD